MSVFDSFIPKIYGYMESLRRQDRPARVWDHGGSVDELLKGLPVSVGPRANPGLILLGETFVDLGHPEAGSCAFVLWSEDKERIRDGRVTLIGPDIPEARGGSLPLGQIVLLAGSELTQSDQRRLDNAQYISNQIEGYMIRSVSQLIWSRVSMEAGEKGFCFDYLGRAIMAVIKTELPKVEAAEILFVTTGKDDLAPLEDLSEQVRSIARKLLSDDWKAKGFNIYECTLGWDCNVCPDQEVCDDIRDIINIRKVSPAPRPEAGNLPPS